MTIGATELQFHVTYHVLPYELCWYEGSLYLVGDSSSQHRRFRAWELDSIFGAHVERVRFEHRAASCTACQDLFDSMHSFHGY